MSEDFFSTALLGCKWRDVDFPCTGFHAKIQQSIVSHERPDQDGARVESTGRKALTLVAHIPFRNGVVPGKTEKWRNEPKSSLYPDAHRAFLAAMADRSSGMLQHPSLGLILCKPVSCDSSLEPARRDGEDVVAEWIETRGEDDALGAVFGRSVIAGAVVTAADLDSRLFAINTKVSDPDGGVPSFEDSLRNVQAVFDKASLLSNKAFGVLNRIAYRLNAIAESVNSLRDPQLWQIKDSIARLLESTRAIKEAAGKGTRDVRFYITPGISTLGYLAAHLSNKVTDLILLNPALVSSPTIPEQTVVRYYVSSIQ